MKKTLFMETTKIPVGQTVAEIQRILGESGVIGVMTQYDGGEVIALSFQILFLDKTIPFRLPCRWQPIFDIMSKRRRRTPSNKGGAALMEQAKRVAWRQILRWVEAQLALVDTDMVKVQEVFLPYIQTNISGQTLYQQLESKKFQAIGYQKDSHDQHEER